MGALLLCAGAKGRRFALPHSRIMIHQLAGGAQGQATDVEIQAKEMLRMKKRLNEIVSRHTGHPIEKVLQDMERDYYMEADEAVTYGLIDKVIESIVKTNE